MADSYFVLDWDQVHIPMKPVTSHQRWRFGLRKFSPGCY